MRVAHLGMAAALLMGLQASGPLVVAADDIVRRRQPKSADAEAPKPQFRHAPAPLPRYPSRAERDAFNAAAARRIRRNAKRAPAPGAGSPEGGAEA